MKPIVPILGVVSALWLFLGTWWMSSTLCNPDNNPTFSVSDNGFNAGSKEMFTFLMATDSIFYTKETQSAFQKIANHLTNNPEKQLILTGLYNSNEENRTTYDNLGIARSKTIKSILTDLNANGENIQTLSSKVNNLSFNSKRKMIGGVNFLFEDKITGTSSSGENGLSSDNEAEPPVTEFNNTNASKPFFIDVTEVSSSFSKEQNFHNYFKSLIRYLDENPKKKLIVTCYNNDSDLATKITKTVRNVFRQNGVEVTTQIKRVARKVDESPTGKPGVNVVVE